jgi:hypothetical protein
MNGHIHFFRVAALEQPHHAVNLDGFAMQLYIAQLATRIWQTCGIQVLFLSPCSGFAQLRPSSSSLAKLHVGSSKCRTLEALAAGTWLAYNHTHTHTHTHTRTITKTITRSSIQQLRGITRNQMLWLNFLCKDSWPVHSMLQSKAKYLRQRPRLSFCTMVTKQRPTRNFGFSSMYRITAVTAGQRRTLISLTCRTYPMMCS